LDDEYGEECNREFRLQFASYLGERFESRDLRKIWLFLIARQRDSGMFGSVYHRLMAFTGDTRRPPVSWLGANEWISKDILQFVSKKQEGQRLSEAITAFWDTHGAILADDMQICPKAQADWKAGRKRLVDAILAEEKLRRQPKS
jgi:hypothetical protein